MDRTLYLVLKQTLEKNRITIKELCSIFYASDLHEVLEIIEDIFKDNFNEFLNDEKTFYDYLLFLNKLVDMLTLEDDLIALRILVEKNIKVIKAYLKEYNKGIKQKDKKYYTCTLFLNRLRNFLDIFKYREFDNKDSEEFMIMWFLITELKKSDYLFRMIELYPDYVNLRNKEKVHILILLMEYIMSNLKHLTSEDIKYFKRVFVMFLESDALRLKNEELYSILDFLEKNKISASIENKRVVNFFINEIERHYEIINQDSRFNAVDYCFKKHPIEIITRTKDERTDFTKLFTLSIDSAVGAKRMVEDAFSIRKRKDGTFYVYLHMPDVDYFIKKDSELDLFMRSLGETVYAKDYKKPMVPYNIATKSSLVAGDVRPAITIRAHLNERGKILDVDFYKSLVRVNYNLNRRQAEIFMKNNNDAKLFVLNETYELAKYIRKNRKEKIGKRKKGFVIMDEMNILADVVTADYFMQKGIIFPYKNYAGKRSSRNVEDVSKCQEYASDIQLSDAGKCVLYSVFDIYNRVYYDTVFHENKTFNDKPVGNVGNPLREYISLETSRLIKDLIIDKLNNTAYWEERIERDCIEYTETTAKIKQLYRS